MERKMKPETHKVLLETIPRIQKWTNELELAAKEMNPHWAERTIVQLLMAIGDTRTAMWKDNKESKSITISDTKERNGNNENIGGTSDNTGRSNSSVGQNISRTGRNDVQRSEEGYEKVKQNNELRNQGDGGVSSARRFQGETQTPLEKAKQ